MSIQQRIEEIKGQIASVALACQRNPHNIQLIAVSKGQPLSAIAEAVSAGQRDFGENYLQEALDKIQQLATLDLVWHFIGSIQSNKTRPIAEHFSWVHSVPSLKIAQRLNGQRPVGFKPLNICIQVNVDQDPQKDGVTLAALPELAHAIAALPHITLRGLMTIPANDTLDHATVVFKQLKEAYEQLKAQGLALDTLSMGMSNDFEAAIREGATHIRIGTAIFGPRQKR